MLGALKKLAELFPEVEGLESRDWTERAYCKDRDPSEYYLDTYQEEQGRKKLRSLDIPFEKLCPSSCPVRTQCALDAIAIGATGTVRAGVPVPTSLAPKIRDEQNLKLAAEASGGRRVRSTKRRAEKANQLYRIEQQNQQSEEKRQRNYEERMRRKQDRRKKGESVH